MNEIPVISCPLDCLPSFSEVREYDSPHIDRVLREDAIYSPRILDIGANVGAFSVWAASRWPRSIIRCFEPNPSTFQYLIRNVGEKQVECVNSAVTIHDEGILWVGNDTALCSAMNKWERANQSSVEVNTAHPKLLPLADIVKIDCEGGEADILENLTFIPAFLALEWHSDDLRVRCENALRGKMSLVESKVSGPNYGLMKFVRVRK